MSTKTSKLLHDVKSKQYLLIAKAGLAVRSEEMAIEQLWEQIFIQFKPQWIGKELKSPLGWASSIVWLVFSGRSLDVFPLETWHIFTYHSGNSDNRSDSLRINNERAERGSERQKKSEKYQAQRKHNIRLSNKHC